MQDRMSIVDLTLGFEGWELGIDFPEESPHDKTSVRGKGDRFEARVNRNSENSYHAL